MLGCEKEKRRKRVCVSKGKKVSERKREMRQLESVPENEK
jgi:hypothetical protein